MSEPYLAEIRIVGFNFAPRGYALCDGQLLPINQYQALYSILGTTYGGDGRTTFALPDLRSRAPMHKSNTHPLGQKGGAETVTLTSSEMPAHNHDGTLNASTDPGNENSVQDNVLGKDGDGSLFYANTTANLKNMSSTSLSNVGGGQSHNNIQPFQTLNFVIALQGLFPPRN